MDINFETLEDLHQTVSSAFNRALANTPPMLWQTIAMRQTSGGTRNVYPFLGETGGMREWVGDAVFEQLASHRYAIENRKFQKGLTAHLDEIMDDADSGLSLYAGRAEVLADAVAQHPDELVIGDVLANGETLLCYDGQPFFDTAHPSADGSIAAQSNLDTTGGGTPWYLLDLRKRIKPLIYQVRVPMRLDAATSMDQFEVMRTHKFYWNAWTRDSAGFGQWWTAFKSYNTLNEANFKARRDDMRAFHIGETNPLDSQPRSAGINPTHILVPRSLQTTAEDLFGQRILASGEENTLFGAVQILVSDHL